MKVNILSIEVWVMVFKIQICSSNFVHQSMQYYFHNLQTLSLTHYGHKRSKAPHLGHCAYTWKTFWLRLCQLLVPQINRVPCISVLLMTTYIFISNIRCIYLIGGGGGISVINFQRACLTVRVRWQSKLLLLAVRHRWEGFPTNFNYVYIMYMYVL